mmetsp:Transcript_9013/g.15347  ORF Transcript_9013/g.15347 Transcript_9013/m.15347 type:complete len:538 (-) Transcript_9013:47-1660(-)
MDNSELSSPLLYSPAFSGDDVGDADDRYDSLGKTSKQHTSSRSLTSSLLATSGSSSGGDPERGEGRSSGIDAPAMEHKMSGFMLAVLIFFTMSGGPIGVEPSIRAAGNLYAIIGFAVMPFLWALPEVLITTELGLRYPCASGGVRWCEEAFGPKAGLLVGYLGWISGVANNATLPVLFLQYVLNQFYPHLYDDINALLRYGILVGITLLLTIVNYRGVEIVGKVLLFVLVISMAPFLIMVIMGIPQVNTDRWLQTPNGETETFNDDMLDLSQSGWFPWQYAAGIALRPFINNLYWCYNGFDQGGHYSNSVTKDVFKRGMAGAFFLTCSSYLVPVLIATGASNLSQSEWTAGAFATAATEIGGKWLGNWMVVGAGLSLMALFFGEMSADSLQLMGMAELGQVPSIFATKSRYNTPTYAILLGMAVILCLIPFDFQFIIELSNVGYCFAVTMEYMAFFQLRIRKANDIQLLRKIGNSMLLIPTLLFNLLVICLASYVTYIYAVSMIAFGVVLIHATSIWRCIKRDKVGATQDAKGATPL